MVGTRILIVDDNATNRSILHHQVISWKMLNGSAENAYHALELLRNAASSGVPYDIAILDMMMPGMDGLDLAKAIKSDPDISKVHLIMLTSVGQYGDAEAARKSGIEAYLTKPVRQSQLYECLVSVMISTAKGGPAKPTVKPRPKRAAAYSYRLLLAEDNSVNQWVARDMLESLGYRVHIVATGAEVLEAVSRTKYDLILMDCQMPVMDGYEATRILREREQSGGKPRTPIIAVTARAMDGDREQCLAVGMDDYLSKPFMRDQVSAVLDKWLPQGVDTEPAESASQPPGESTSAIAPIEPDAGGHIDAAILKRIDAEGIADLSTELIKIYVNDTPQVLEHLRSAVQTEDPVSVCEAAHSLKSSSAYIGATRLAALCKQLEEMGRAKSIDNAGGIFAKLELEYAQARECLLSNLQGRNNG